MSSLVISHWIFAITTSSMLTCSLWLAGCLKCFLQLLSLRQSVLSHCSHALSHAVSWGVGQNSKQLHIACLPGGPQLIHKKNSHTLALPCCLWKSFSLPRQSSFVLLHCLSHSISSFSHHPYASDSRIISQSLQIISLKPSFLFRSRRRSNHLFYPTEVEMYHISTASTE